MNYDQEGLEHLALLGQDTLPSPAQLETMSKPLVCYWYVHAYRLCLQSRCHGRSERGDDVMRAAEARIRALTGALEAARQSESALREQTSTLAEKLSAAESRCVEFQRVSSAQARVKGGSGPSADRTMIEALPGSPGTRIEDTRDEHKWSLHKRSHEEGSSLAQFRWETAELQRLINHLSEQLDVEKLASSGASATLSDISATLLSLECLVDEIQAAAVE